jgi:hydroxymethylpyrimidine pyrophosphatase-like HAD family hydrolase
MRLPDEIVARIRRFYDRSEFSTRGGIVTDLDGTAVHEAEGRLTVAETVAQGLRIHADMGRPVVLNTLRFPLNVIRTFGRVWSSITADPIPLVSLNGSVVGLLRPTDEGETTFDEIARFTLPPAMIEEMIGGVRALCHEGIDDIVVFHYAPDWTHGETVWTPHQDRVQSLQAKFVSASRVIASAIEGLREMLLSQGACMLSLLVDIPADRRMAYQHANPNRFLTATGVDKLSGAREAAARFGFDLDQSVGAGDTPMDRFLAGVGLALHVGQRELEDRGRLETVRLRDPIELGAALFTLAGLEHKGSHA